MTNEDPKIPEEVIEAQEMFEKHFMGPQDNDCDHEGEDLKHVFNGFMMGYLCAKDIGDWNDSEIK